jgi:hypothetical protein
MIWIILLVVSTIVFIVSIVGNEGFDNDSGWCLGIVLSIIVFCISAITLPCAIYSNFEQETYLEARYQELNIRYKTYQKINAEIANGILNVGELEIKKSLLEQYNSIFAEIRNFNAYVSLNKKHQNLFFWKGIYRPDISNINLIDEEMND